MWSFGEMFSLSPKTFDFEELKSINVIFEQNSKTSLPVTVQVYRAACNGFHIEKFINELQEAMNTLKLDGIKG